ncbi:MAG: ABC-2 family transporter protein [Planctomycetota bacterium]
MRERLSFALRVGGQYARIGLVRKSQFRWEFVNQVVMDCLYYLSFLLTFHILYGFRDGLTLAGWTREDIRVFLGMSFVTDAFMMTWLGQNWHFGEDLKSGGLDAFRMRPGPVWFTYTFQRFSPEGLTNMVVALGILGYGLVHHPAVDGASWALLPVAIGIGCAAQIGLVITFQALEFWVVNADFARFFSNVFSQIADRPLDVYPRGMKRLFLWAIPLGGLAWYPAGLVIGKLSAGFAVGYAAVVALFVVLATRLFVRGMRRYESALG